MTKRVVKKPYFDFLYGFIGSISDKNPDRSHFLLAEQLDGIYFEWDRSIPGDYNRAVDALNLREQYGYNHPGSDDIQGVPSVLEVIIRLAQRVEFLAYGSDMSFGSDYWFWIMMDNLGLTRYTDDVYCREDPDSYNHVEQVIDNLLNRRYGYSGDGGLFPLENPSSDQREVELWYQMASYVLEKTDLI